MWIFGEHWNHYKAFYSWIHFFNESSCKSSYLPYLFYLAITASRETRVNLYCCSEGKTRTPNADFQRRAPTWPGMIEVQNNTLQWESGIPLCSLSTIWDSTFSFPLGSSLHDYTSDLGVVGVMISGVWSQDRKRCSTVAWLSCLLIKE